MGTLENMLNMNGVGIMSMVVMNIWAIRFVLAYLKETRDEYRSRLNDAIIELEQQKTLNIRLELRLQTMEHMAK